MVDGAISAIERQAAFCHVWFDEAQEAFAVKDAERHAAARASHEIAVAFFRLALKAKSQT
jgi:hypothetical protein